MADVIKPEVLIDIEDIGKSVNIDGIITPRYGDPFKSLPMVSRENEIKTNQIEEYIDEKFSEAQQQIDLKAPLSITTELQQQKVDKTYFDTTLSSFQNGAVKTYPTLAAANADIANIALNTKVSVLSATEGGDYYKASADATSLTKSPWDPIKQSISYTNEKTKNIEESSYKNLDEAVDVNLNVYRYTDPNGGLHLSGLDHSVQDSINAKFSNEAANRMIYQNILIAKYSAIKNLVPVATQAEDGLRARMPSAIKTPTGLVYFYHKQIPTFDGDFQGSELWKAIITINEDLSVNVASRELFLAPDQPRGIVKHPMLGRTSDGRILLVFEKRLEVNEKYVQHQCYSNDEGLTFTNPVVMTMNGVNPAGANGSNALGTTGTIVTAKNNRLIVPMYTLGGACYCIYSDDDGASWTFSAWVNTSQVSGFEPSISLDMDNNLIMDVRPKTPSYRLKAKSLDNGLTWQAMTTQQVPSTTNQGVIFRDKEIGMMIQTTNANSASGARDHYSLFLSYDNAETFPFSYMPFSTSWYGGYSQLLKWKDGIYIIAIEYADAYIASNVNENSGLLILSLSEVMRNVSLN